MEAYSMDLRIRVVKACDEGFETRTEIAERFDVSTSWIRRILQRRRETGSIAPLPHGGGPEPTFNEARLEQLRNHIQQHPDATLEELREHLGLNCSLTVIWTALNKLRLSYKKDPTGC